MSTKTWVKASVAHPLPERIGKIGENKLEKVKPVESSESFSQSKIDYVPSYIIAVIQISLLIAKVGAGLIYQDKIWQSIDWLWILSPLWVTHAFAILWLIATIGRKGN